MSESQQLPDGRFVPAHPIPFYKDTRSFFRRLWHAVLVARGYDADELMEPYWVPMEPPYDKPFPRG